MNKITILTLIAILGVTTLPAQILTPAKWHYNISKENINKGDEVELIFRVKLDETWHLYSNEQNYELGPLPTVFMFEPNHSYQLLGTVKAIGYVKVYDPTFEVYVNCFENIAEFRQKIKVLSKKPVIKGSYEYQVCSTINGKCIMGIGDFEFNPLTRN